MEQDKMGGGSISPQIFLGGNSLLSQVSEAQNENSWHSASVCLSVSLTHTQTHTHTASIKP